MNVEGLIRVYDLAREVKQEPKRIIEELRRAGANVSVPSNTVPAELAEKIRQKYLPIDESLPKRKIIVIRRKPNVENSTAISPATENKTDIIKTQSKVSENVIESVLELTENRYKIPSFETLSNSQKEHLNNVTVDKSKVDCQDCNKLTQHSLLYSADMPDVEWSEKYQIVQCMKCDNLSFRRILFKNNKEEIDLYPSRIEGRKKISLEYIPPIIEQIYGEIYLALSSKMLIIATTGMRTIIELICKDQNSKAKNLKDKIDELVKMHLLTIKNANNLHKLRDFGNDAAHEASVQSENTLFKCMDIIEHLLKDIYYPDIST